MIGFCTVCHATYDDIRYIRWHQQECQPAPLCVRHQSRICDCPHMHRDEP